MTFRQARACARRGGIFATTFANRTAEYSFRRMACPGNVCDPRDPLLSFDCSRMELCECTARVHPWLRGIER